MNKPEFVRNLRANFKTRYGNYIGGEWVEPVSGRYFDNTSPVNGQVLCEIARSDAADVERALDAAHAAKDAWGRTSAAERAVILNAIAQRMEDNLAMLAEAETWDNGKPIRERRPPTCRSPSTISAISPAASAPRKAGSRRSTTIRSPIISTSRSASSARSSRGISRS